MSALAVPQPYVGWRLEESDYDRSKGSVIYYAVRGTERHMLDWSSYRRFGQASFEMMVDMGFPTRAAMPEGARLAPLWPEDVADLYAAWAAELPDGDEEIERDGGDDYSDFCESEPPLTMDERHAQAWAEHQEARR